MSVRLITPFVKSRSMSSPYEGTERVL